MRIRYLEIRNFRGIKSLSWHVKGDFNCIIGPGDTCKTTILTAMDYALSPRASLSVDDSDFFNQDIEQDIVIQVTLTDWDETQTDIRKLFQEKAFAQYKCGLDSSGPLPEPQSENSVAFSVALRVDKSLEPKWFAVKGREEDEESERKPLYAADRAILGLSRLDVFSDYHFTWGRNTILTRLSAGNEGNLSAVLSDLAREMRQGDISGHESIAECQGVADKIKKDSNDAGVKLTTLTPKIDIQRRSMTAGALSLHEDDVPLRNKGSGTKKLIATAMQMKLHGGKNISLIDEIEMGLEPHRIRGLIHRLKSTGQQIFTTTHSPVVIRELNVADDELYVCRRDADGNITLNSIATVPGIQGEVRSNPEAFLGSKIIACEGLTEIGCLRAYDEFRFAGESAPVWGLATSYFNAGSGGHIKGACPKLLSLGYQTAALCDNDAQDQLSDEDVRVLRDAGIHVCQWESDNSTEHQLFQDMPWRYVPGLLRTITDNHDTLELATVIDCIRKDERLAGHEIDTNLDNWSESPVLRKIMGDLVRKCGWIKRIDYSAKTFEFALPLLSDDCVLNRRLGSLWDWIQNE